jgi:hypothetical protein
MPRQKVAGKILKQDVTIAKAGTGLRLQGADCQKARARKQLVHARPVARHQQFAACRTHHAILGLLQPDLQLFFLLG